MKLSSGLEPETPSLPWRFWGVTRGCGRAFTTTKAPQTNRIWQREVARAWTPVVAFVFAPRSHGGRRRRTEPVDQQLMQRTGFVVSGMWKIDEPGNCLSA